MNITNKLLYPIVTGVLFNACSSFNQNDFICTESIAEIETEKFIYSAYKMGIDNYRIKFKVITDVDTSDAFEIYMNDAFYSKEHSFHFKTSRDTLAI